MTPKTMFFRIFMAIGFLTVVSAVPEDTNPNCQGWADAGECEKNPSYMLKGCATSCERLAAAALREAEELKQISSFFDLSANDIFGEPIQFSKFAGQVTVLVNVASECGYTDSHYRGLTKLWRQVKFTDQINILAFPCDQFGHQEPGTNQEINRFAVEEYGVDFTMMEKIDVNGPDASIVYKYLKSKAGPSSIGWNFATYYVVHPDGAIKSYSGVEPMELKDELLGILPADEL